MTKDLPLNSGWTMARAGPGVIRFGDEDGRAVLVNGSRP
jgi:hypothetical protein